MRLEFYLSFVFNGLGKSDVVIILFLDKVIEVEGSLVFFLGSFSWDTVSSISGLGWFGCEFRVVFSLSCYYV